MFVNGEQVAPIYPNMNEGYEDGIEEKYVI